LLQGLNYQPKKNTKPAQPIELQQIKNHPLKHDFAAKDFIFTANTHFSLETLLSVTPTLIKHPCTRLVLL